MKGRDRDGLIVPENEKSRRFPAKRLLIPVLFAMIFLVSLLIVVTILSQDAHAAYGVQVNVQLPKDKDMNASMVPQSINFTIEVENTGTFVENVNLTVTFDNPSKPVAGWTVNPNNFTVNTLGAGAIETREVLVTAPLGEPYPSFAQLTVLAVVQENTSQTSQDSFIARVSPIWDAELTPHADVFSREPGDTINVRLQLLNTGTATDTLTLEDITPAPYDTWGQVALPAQVTLEAGNSTNMDYTITIDPDVTMAESPITLYLAVTSQGAGGTVETQQITIYINQTFGVLVTTTQNTKTGDPGEEVSFTIRIRNVGNDIDTFILDAFGPELGAWSVPDVTLAPDEFIFVYYNLTINPDHDTSDILITLNASSWEAESIGQVVFDTLEITIHVNPRYAVELGQLGGDRKDGSSGQVVYFDLRVTNEGTALDNFEIHVDTPSGFSVTLSDPTIEIESVVVDPLNSTKTVNISVQLRSDPLISIGEYYLNITATSLNDENATDTFTFIIDVYGEYDFDLYVPPGVGTDPGVTITILIQLTNEGNIEDTIRISISDLPPGWSHDPIPDVPLDGSVTVPIYIHIPLNTPSDFYNFTITARSLGDPSKEDSASTGVEVNQVYDVLLPTSISNKNVDPGSYVTYAIEVNNKGNGDDIIELRLTGEVEPWTWLYYNAIENGTVIHLSLPAGGTATVFLYVAPPSNYWDTGDGTVALIIEAESLDDPDINPASDSVSVTTYVNDVYEFGVSGSGSRSGIPGETVTFLLTIDNGGTSSDSFNLRMLEIRTDTGGTISYWEDVNINPFSVNPVFIGQGAQQIVDVDIEIPYPLNLYEVPKGEYIIEVEIKSSGDSSIIQTINFTVIVKQLYAAEVVNSISPKNVDVGSSVTYVLQVKNSGNSADNISIEVEDDVTIAGDQTLWTSVTHNGQGFSSIWLDAGDVAWVNFTVTIPQRNDPGYPSADPSYVAFPVTVSPSKPDDPGALKEELDIITNINPIYEFEVYPIVNRNDVPGQTVDFSITIKNTGTGSDTYTPELIWSENWDAYQTGIIFSPDTITIGPGLSGTITMYITIPSDHDVALAGEYSNNVTISSDYTNEQTIPFTVEVNEVYGLELTDPSSLIKAVNVGNSVTYQFKVKNTGNAQDTFVLNQLDLDTSTGGGGDQSSWTFFALTSDPTTSIISFTLAPGDWETIVFTINVPPLEDPDFEKLSDDLFMEVKVASQEGTNLDDSFTTRTTINPEYLFEVITYALDNTKEGKPGEAVTFQIEVTNTGTGKDRYYFDFTSWDDNVFPSPNVDDINVDVEVDTSKTTTATVSIIDTNDVALTGTYPLEITGVSQSDSLIRRTIIIYVTIQPVAGVKVEADPSTGSEEPGKYIDYPIKITNQGNAIDTFRLTKTGETSEWGVFLNGTNLTPQNEFTIAADRIEELILRVTIPTAGETEALEPYGITVKATSSLEDISDTMHVTTTVEEFMDLQLEYSGTGEARRDYDPNKNAPEFSFRVTNYGNQDENPLEIRVDGIESDWDYTPKTISATIEPGGSSIFSIEFITVPDDENEGEYEMRVVVVSSVDPSVESDPVYIIVNITKPDLVIEQGDISGLDDLDGLRSIVGNAITITATIHNEGHSSAEDIRVRLFEDNNVRGTSTITSLDPGAHTTVDFRWTVVAEDVEIRVEITPIEELDDGNNAEAIQIDLRSELLFTEEEIIFSKSRPGAGERITISALILNRGGNAEDVVVKFYEGTKIIGTDTLDIDFDEIGEAMIEWKVPDRPGETRVIRAEIDYLNTPGHTSSKEIDIGGRYDSFGDGDEFFVQMIGLLVFIALVAFIIGYIGGLRTRMRKEETDQEYPWQVEYQDSYEGWMPPEEEPWEEPGNMLPPPPPPPPEL